MTSAPAQQTMSHSASVDDTKESVDEKKTDERIVFSTQETFDPEMKWTGESILRQDDCKYK